jgi:hypothetical protein
MSPIDGYSITEQVRTVIALARADAQRRGLEQIAPQNLLLGFIAHGGGVGFAVLQEHGITMDALRRDAEEGLPPPVSGDPVPRDLPFTALATTVLRRSMDEARELAHTYVGTEHLILALLHDPDSASAKLLSSHGVRRASTLRMLGEREERPVATPLFSRDELGAAFALLLPGAHANELATRWFEQFAEEVDEHGRYVHPEPWASPDDAPPPPAAAERPDWSSAEWIERDEAFFQHFDEAAADDWLMRMGDLHLSLVALVNDDLFARMMRVRGMTESMAARNRLQMQRAVRAYRRSRGWPPAV